MRILIVNSVCGYGSTGRICTDLGKVLVEQGNEVTIAYGRGGHPAGLPFPAVKFGTQVDASMHGIQARLFDRSGLGSAQSTKRLLKLISEYHPDLIHLHNVHGYYLNVPMLFRYLRQSSIRVVWTLHDTWAVSGHSGTCDKVQCRKWETGCYQCPLKSEYPATFFDRSGSNWEWKKETFSGLTNLTLVTPSQWLANIVGSSFLKSYNTFVINNGIDTNIFRCKEPLSGRTAPGSQGRIKILGVSNAWSKYKGLDDFCKLSGMLDQNIYEITLVGLTEKQLGNLPKEINGIQRTQSIEELVELYNAADVFVNMTYCDVFPTVNLESLACGTPVITYDTGGCAETVQGYGGVVVARGNISEILNKLDIARSQRVDVEAVKRKYSSKRAANEYLHLYQSIVE